MNEQTCHLEPSKICEIEMKLKVRPKKVKKYNYTKDCKEQLSEICDQCVKRTTELVCVMQECSSCKCGPKVFIHNPHKESRF